MDVYLCFGKSVPLMAKHADLLSPMMAHFVEAHSSVMLVFLSGTGDGKLTVYDINVNSHVFEEQHVNADVDTLRGGFDFLDACVNAEEYARILATCQACVRSRKRYNYRDVVLYNVPFRSPMEKSLYETDTLFDAQAAILILRECLSPEHPAIPALRALHSRTTMANQLYEMLSPILPCTHASRVCAASYERVSVLQPEMGPPH